MNQDQGSNGNIEQALLSIASALAGNALFGNVMRRQVFTATGTYTPDTNMVTSLCFVVGAGGGGGSATGVAGESKCASGGGAGSLAISILTRSVVGSSKAITIGAGGTAGVTGGAGGAGGDSSIGSLVIGKGGSGGAGASVTTAPGAGGVVGTGDITVRGNDGTAGRFNGVSVAFAITGGAGGASFFGGAPAQAVHIGNQAGKAGSKGAGGSGASTYNSTTTNNGGAGGDGYIVILEFCSS